MSEQIQLPAIPPAGVSKKVAMALNPIDAFGGVAPIALNEPLVPADICRTAMQTAQAEIEDPIGADRASKYGKSIVGQYPKRGKEDFHDPAVFARSLTALLAEYSEPVVREVLKELPRRHRWMPAIADVQDALDERVSARKLIVIGARRQLKEHERRQAESEREATVARDRDQVAKGMAELTASLRSAVSAPRRQEAAE